MTAVEDWVRSKIPLKEEVLWVGRPDQRVIPKHASFFGSWLAAISLVVWIPVLFSLKVSWEYLPLYIIPISTTAILFIDYYNRTHCIYAVTRNSAWIIRKLLISKQPRIKRVEITPSLKIESTPTRIKLKPFFSYDFLEEKDAVLAALHQAQEATK
ncbi:hypothetical protein [Ruegeria atlantica]|uniref:hypothetical protein n=1 Tax=Ruegeria atlantica TaxID=81569 RepID=UPI002495A390|nr:hypothetical protein [Ruegeria atlantica]